MNYKNNFIAHNSIKDPCDFCKWCDLPSTSSHCAPCVLNPDNYEKLNLCDELKTAARLLIEENKKLIEVIDDRFGID